INNSGQVVGVSALPTDQFEHAFSWTPAGGLQDLGTFGTSPDNNSWASAISRSGEIVGFGNKVVHGAHGQQGSAVWTGGQIHELPITLGQSSQAYAVSDVGQVVGVY